MLHPKTSALDGLAIRVLLRGATDAGGPQVGIRDDRVGQLALGDDVGDRQTAAGPQDARRLGEHRGLVGAEVDDAVGDDAVEGPVPRGTLSIAPSRNSTVSQPGASASALALASCSGVKSTPTTPSCTSDLQGGQKRVGARPAAEVENPLAFGECREVEEVPYTGERLEGACGHLVEETGLVAEPVRQHSAHLEVVRLVRMLRDGPVHVLHLHSKLLGVDGGHG